MNNLKKLLNHSEYLLYLNLIDSFEGTKYHILPQQLMKNVICNKNLNLSKKEKEHYHNASFDFVVVDNESNPLFVVEFDGPDHEREKNILADEKKMWICTKALLPIIKIKYDWYEKFPQKEIIQFLVFRYIKWQEEFAELEEEYSSSIKDLVNQGKTLEEAVDYVTAPETEFNYKYYFPLNKEIEIELYEKYHLYPEVLNSEDEFLSSYKQLCDLNFNTNNGIASGISQFLVKGEGVRAKKVEKYERKFKETRVNIKWYYYLDITGTNSTEHQGLSTNSIPGLSLFDLCHMLAEYEGLEIIKKECISLAEKGFVFKNPPSEDLELYYNDNLL